MTIAMIAVVEFSQFWWNLGEAAHSPSFRHLPLRELASSYCFRQEHRFQNKQSSLTHHWSFTLTSNYVDLFWFEQIREIMWRVIFKSVIILKRFPEEQLSGSGLATTVAKLKLYLDFYCCRGERGGLATWGLRVRAPLLGAKIFLVPNTA